MPTGADIKERVGDSSHDSNSNMTQEQSFKKGKNHTQRTLVMRKIGSRHPNFLLLDR